jgi:hypothetical protein
MSCGGTALRGQSQHQRSDCAEGCGIRCFGLTAPWIINRPMNRKIFET